MKHTKGIWRVKNLPKSNNGHPHNLMVEGYTGYSARFIAEIPGGRNSEEARANAELIALLPELLQSSKALLDRIDNMTTHEFSLGGEKLEREALRSILDKIS